MSIRRLQQSVISNLRSGVAINTVVQCVQELVENAIDAESTCIAVRLDLQFLKIQIVDNGRGINKQDFELLGERYEIWKFLPKVFCDYILYSIVQCLSRYATSKCHCLDDLDTDSEHFGYRGEALASICGVSQSVTISSRSKLEKGTWSKIFMEGVVSPQGVQKSVVERPSSGTTVTVVGFLHTLPVRRQSVDMILEMEKVKRSMEYTALSHSNISFSLRNDALDVWCFQAPKTSSAVSTFAHLFGSEWSKLFKPLNDSEGPYTLKGHVAVKGSRNKSMQFLFLKKRRLAHNKLQHLINQIASKSSTGFLRGSPLENGDSPKTPTCQKVFTCVETFPVYILEIDCPKDFYDFRLHPSKTVVEFQEFKIVYELVSRAFSDFFGIGLQNERNFSVNKQLQPIHTTAHSSLHINVHDCVNSLHSLPVKRCYNVSNRESSQIQVENVKKLMGPHFEHSNTTQKSLLSTSLSQSCTTASIRSVRAPTLKNSTLRDRFSLRPDECKDSPIRLPTSLDSSLTPLGRLTHKKEQQQRLKRTLRDLRKFSRRNPSPVASHHNVEKKLHESNAIHHMNGDQQLDRLVEEQFTYPSEVLLENEFVEGQEHNTYQNNCDMTDDESRMISFNEMAIRKTSDELISTFCRRKGDTSVRSPVLLEPKVRMARSLEDSQKHGLKVVQDDQSFIGDQDIEDVNPAKLTAVNKEHPKVKQVNSQRCPVTPLQSHLEPKSCFFK